jgi:hypothetical protein
MASHDTVFASRTSSWFMLMIWSIRRSLVTDAAAHDGVRLCKGLIDPGQYRLGGLGGHWLPLGHHRGVSHQDGQGQPHFSQEAQGQADSKAACQLECHEVPNPGPDRACLCRAEGSHKVLHQDDWACPCKGHRHTRQHGVQHEATVLAQRPEHARIGGNQADRGPTKFTIDLEKENPVPTTWLSNANTAQWPVYGSVRVLDVDKIGLLLLAVTETAQDEAYEGVSARSIEPLVKVVVADFLLRSAPEDGT